MSTDDREPFREARAAGLKARQERRLENATYTAAEVKVLTEAALRLGRKEAGEQIAEAAEEAADDLDLPIMPEWLDQRSWFKGQLHDVAAKAREIGLQPSPDATSGRTDSEAK